MWRRTSSNARSPCRRVCSALARSRTRRMPRQLPTPSPWPRPRPGLARRLPEAPLRPLWRPAQRRPRPNLAGRPPEALPPRHRAQPRAAHVPPGLARRLPEAPPLLRRAQRRRRRKRNPASMREWMQPCFGRRKVGCTKAQRLWESCSLARSSRERSPMCSASAFGSTSGQKRMLLSGARDTASRLETLSADLPSTTSTSRKAM
mmetsp:Transcript_26846/g.68872  ORF Transcript_26846/g.68872 Transcript_26846/m.68872 type:complete len:204 (-) Transcript_26846:192-803(-)